MIGEPILPREQAHSDVDEALEYYPTRRDLGSHYIETEDHIDV